MIDGVRVGGLHTGTRTRAALPTLIDRPRTAPNYGTNSGRKTTLRPSGGIRPPIVIVSMPRSSSPLYCIAVARPGELELARWRQHSDRTCI